MRQIYTSPRQENIDRVVALMAEHAIEATIMNRSSWNRPTYQRFSYSERDAKRDSWPQVWISHADDYIRARALLREIGIEPVVRYADELAASRDPTFAKARQDMPTRIRRIVLAAVLAAFGMVVLRYLHMF